MSELLLIKPRMACQWRRPAMATHTTAMRSLTLRVNDYPAVRVPVNRIPGLSTQTGRLLGGLHQRSTFSRRLCV